MSNDDHTRPLVALLMDRLGEARDLLAEGRKAEAMWRLEFAASALVERREQLALAEALTLHLLSEEPNRRRQNLLCRVLLHQGREAEAEAVRKGAMPYTEQELADQKKAWGGLGEWLKKNPG